MSDQRRTPPIAPLPLNSLQDICRICRVGRDTVRNWVRQGAPIAVEGGPKKPRYSAEYNTLQAWRVRGARADG